jgi:hypothetical protein
LGESIKGSNLDKIVRKCYQSIIKSGTGDIFIVYEDIDEVVEIPYNIEQRKKAIEKVIAYFEELEEYEICHSLFMIKEKIS